LEFSARQADLRPTEEQLKLLIVSGGYPPGSKLPSVRDLASEASVNPNTLQRR
jgi:DNA-binding transcriptional regulator YhcF (GntR family)